MSHNLWLKNYHLMTGIPDHLDQTLDYTLIAFLGRTVYTCTDCCFVDLKQPSLLVHVHNGFFSLKLRSS